MTQASELIRLAGSVNTLWAFAGLCIAALVVIVMLRRSRRVEPAVLSSVIAVTALVLVTTIILSVVDQTGQLGSAYRVRVTVLDPTGRVRDDVVLQSPARAEITKAMGGWQIDVPSGAVPGDGQLPIFAHIPNTTLTAQTTVVLAQIKNPTAILNLHDTGQSVITGVIMDEDRHGISGIRVRVVGYDTEGIVTAAGGQFVLRAHHPVGEEVAIHVEGAGYEAKIQEHVVNEVNRPAYIVLHKK